MPKLVTEINAGTQFSSSSNEGQLVDAQNRAYRIIKQTISELVDIQAACNVRIGDQHPYNKNLYCTSFDARFEGDSRMVILVTFNYESTPSGESSTTGGGDPKAHPPAARKANWTIASSLYEKPVLWWRERTAASAWGAPKPAANPARDMYDGVAALDAMVTISIQQWGESDPTRHARHVGAVNSETITLGSLVMPPHTVMLRGITSDPQNESWGGALYRGWNCVYEFAYKANDTQIWIGTDEEGGTTVVELGWDVAIPQSGMNVIAFDTPGREIDDPFGQPLKWNPDTREIDPDDPPQLAAGVNVGGRVRAMVRVPVGEKASQNPSAQPIALNDNGRPRADDLAPIVRGYQVHRDINFTNTLGLRLF